MCVAETNSRVDKLMGFAHAHTHTHTGWVAHMGIDVGQHLGVSVRALADLLDDAGQVDVGLGFPHTEAVATIAA